jgi:hypothetical protein
MLMALMVLWIPTDGVKVPVQVCPPSLVVSVLRVPLATLTLLLLNPITFSEKVIVTLEVTPILSVGVPSIIELMLGARVSTV